MYKQRFTFSGIDRDNSPIAVDERGVPRRLPSSYYELVNGRIGSSDDGQVGPIENIRGNTKINHTLPSGTNKCIGWCIDNARQELIYFNYNSNNDHGIYAYNHQGKSVQLLLKGDFLNFSPDKYITAQIIDGMLYFTDGYERVLNLELLRPDKLFEANIYVSSIPSNTNVSFNFGATSYDEEISINYQSITSISGPKTATQVATELRSAFLSSPFFSHFSFELDGTIIRVRAKSKLGNWEFRVSSQEVYYWIDVKNYYRFPLTSKAISFIKCPPIHPPYNPSTGTYLERGTDEAVENFISDNAYQFAYRYRYKDNSKSVFSAISRVSRPNIYHAHDSAAPNYVEFDIDVEEDIIGAISSIDIAYIRNNDGQYRVFKTLYGGEFKKNNSLRFYGNEPTVITPDAEIKSMEPVSREQHAMSIIEDRHFSTEDVLDFDVDETEYTLEVELSGSGSGNEMYFKRGGQANFGVVFYDEFMRMCSVKSVKTLKFPYWSTSNNTTIDTNYRQAIINFSGRPPEWARYYSVARTRDQKYDTFIQFAANVYFYAYDIVEGSGVPEGLVERNGILYHEDAPAEHDSYLHLQMPANVPIYDQVDFYVRIVPDIGQDRIEKVDEIRGDMLAVKNFGKRDWTGVDFPLLVEVFTLTEEYDEIFYETGQIYEVNNPGTPNRSFSENSVQVAGDTHVVSFGGDRRWVFIDVEPDKFNYPVSEEITGIAESMTNHFKGIIATGESKFLLEVGIKRNLFFHMPKIKPVKVQAGYSEMFVPDYKKIYFEGGRVTTVFRDEQEQRQQNVVRYSNKYIQDSKINGLSSFDSPNKYTISSERGRITALVPVDESILLAIHPTTTTSLYIGQGFIRQSDGSEVLTKTEGVVGADRPLGGGYGTVNPESIVLHSSKIFEEQGSKTRAYWWDAHKGAVVRYAYNGIYPISNYGMREYFLKKSKLYAGTGAKIIGGFDPEHDEYLITFPAIPGAEAETWAFSERENRWIYRVDMVPEMFAQLGTNLFSWKDGELWEHNSSGLFNNFYGVQYNRRLRGVAVVAPGKVKIWTGFWIKQNRSALNIDTPILLSTDTGQNSHIYNDYLVEQEGIFKSAIYRDTNTPNVGDTLHAGDVLRSQTLEFEISSDRVDKDPLYWIDVIFKLSEQS